jgi:hypothetical protein
MKLIKYFIKDKYGRGLHYIQGSLYWRAPLTIEAIENFTSFHTMTDAFIFINSRNIKESCSLGKITIEVS